MINLELARSKKLLEIFDTHFPGAYSQIDALPKEEFWLSDIYKGLDLDEVEIKDQYIDYLILANTDFFWKTDDGFLGVFHYTPGVDFIVSYCHGNSVAITGDSLSNWARNVIPLSQKNLAEAFIADCSSVLGIADTAFDPHDLNIDLERPSWSPIKL